MTQVTEILPCGRQWLTYLKKVKTMAADDLVMHGARALAAMILTYFADNNPGPACQG